MHSGSIPLSPTNFMNLATKLHYNTRLESLIILGLTNGSYDCKYGTFCLVESFLMINVRLKIESELNYIGEISRNSLRLT